MANKPNIIFILLDALRPSNLGCYGYGKNISPILDSFAKKGVLFEKCFSCVNASDPALTSIMSGRYPKSHGIIHHRFVVDHIEIKV